MSRTAGLQAERKAAAYLIRQGFRIVETNYVCRGGELDLICDHAGTLVFVEVRARKSSRYGEPATTVTRLKQRRLVHAARHYLARHHLESRPCRFDVVAIEGDELTHLPNAFEA